MRTFQKVPKNPPLLLSWLSRRSLKWITLFSSFWHYRLASSPLTVPFPSAPLFSAQRCTPLSTPLSLHHPSLPINRSIPALSWPLLLRGSRWTERWHMCRSGMMRRRGFMRGWASRRLECELRALQDVCMWLWLMKIQWGELLLQDGASRGDLNGLRRSCYCSWWKDGSQRLCLRRFASNLD